MIVQNYPPLMPKKVGTIRGCITQMKTRYKMTEAQAKRYLARSRWFCTLEQIEVKLAEKPPCDKCDYKQPYQKKPEAQCDCGVVEKLVTRAGKEMCRYCAAIVNGNRPADPTEAEITAMATEIRKGWGKKRLAAATGTTIRQHVEIRECDFGVLSGRARARMA